MAFRGKHMPIIPEVDGLAADAAESKLTALGLTVVRSDVSSEAVQTGFAIATSPAAGTDVADNTTVTLEVSLGPAVQRPTVPDLIGKTELEARAALDAAGLRLGESRAAPHAKIAAGRVITSTPQAGREVAGAALVELTISTGPAPVTSAPAVGLVTVPDLFGMTATRSKRVLAEFGLQFSTIARKFSDEAPRGAVLSSFPPAGQTVSPGTYVAVDISEGPEPSWAQYVVPALLTAIGLIVVGAILLALFKDDLRLLNRLADRSVARGLITFLIAISTVGIALILAVSTVVSTPTTDDDKRFDRAKQVLTILIGVLGTIVGFYFGSTDDAPATQQQVQTEGPNVVLAAGVVGEAYDQPVLATTGLTAPIGWSSDPDLPPGLSMNALGHLVGTATSPFAKKQMKITATDSATPPKTIEKTVALEIR